jgi:hypothetical protein
LDKAASTVATAAVSEAVVEVVGLTEAVVVSVAGVGTLKREVGSAVVEGEALRLLLFDWHIEAIEKVVTNTGWEMNLICLSEHGAGLAVIWV